MKPPHSDNPSFDHLISTILKLSQPMLPAPTGLVPQLAPLPGIHAVVFDVYGTLFISGSGDIGTVQARAKENALHATLKTAGLSGNLAAASAEGAAQLEAAIRAAHEAAHARGIACPEVDIQSIWGTVFQALIKQGLIASMPPDHALLALMIEYECRVNPVWPMPNIQQVMKDLRKPPQPMILGIVSNAQFYTPLLFQAFFKKPLIGLGFQEKLCAWSHRFREAKPAPALFDHVVSVLRKDYRVPASATVYIGNDMLNDVWAAREAGMKTILFAGDKRSLRLREDDPRCKALQPDRIITGWHQLTSVLPAQSIR